MQDENNFNDDDADMMDKEESTEEEGMAEEKEYSEEASE